MRFSIVLFAIMSCIWLLWLPSLTTAVCCRPTRIRFELKRSIEERTCDTYGGEPDKRKNSCKAKICNDGQIVMGQWCGECNSIGCRCKNGCIQPRSEAIRSFLERNGFSKFVYVRKVPAFR